MNIQYIQKKLNDMAILKRIDDMDNYFSKDEIKHTISRANDLLDNTFYFNKTWDMERCLTHYTLDNIDWNTIKNDDEEWCFMLNRMDFLSDLIIAYLYTNDTKYSNKAKFFILNWIENHATLKKELSTRTLDTAMRIFSWTLALIVLNYKKQLDNNELQSICNSILNQIQYLEDNYINKYKTSNWGTIQTTVIVSILPIFLENYKENKTYNWAYNEMTTQFDIQVYPDGMFWEQSTMYHAEVLNYGMYAIYFCQIFNSTKKEPWFFKVESLADALFYQLTPDFQIEAFGDTDRVEARDIFNRASVLFENSTYKFAGNKIFDIDSLYIFGCDFADKYQKLICKTPEKTIYDGFDSGMFVIKSGWQPLDTFTMFTNGSLGSGHGHSDNLHFSIYHKGEFMLIDSGRFTYREDNPLRMQLKGVSAHNNIILNDSPFCLPDSSWTYENFGTVIKTYVNHNKNYHYLEGGLIGNNPLQILIRKIIIINPSIWLIVDEIKADNVNKATINFNIDPFKKVTLSNDCVFIKGNNSTLKLIQEHSSLNLKTVPCSLKYNELINHSVVSFEREFQNNCEILTTICDENIQVVNVPIYQSDKETPREVGQAKKFIISENESYTIAIYHKEIYQGAKILFCENIPFHNKCIIIHEKNGTKTYKLMKA